MATGPSPGLRLINRCQEFRIKEVSIYGFTQDNMNRCVIWPPLGAWFAEDQACGTRQDPSTRKVSTADEARIEGVGQAMADNR